VVFHWLKVGGSRLNNKLMLLADGDFSRETNSIVKFFVYLQDEPPEGKMSASEQT
jgi:hypothetical protein